MRRRGFRRRHVVPVDVIRHALLRDVQPGRFAPSALRWI
jgi:hypothetical protein